MANLIVDMIRLQYLYEACKRSPSNKMRKREFDKLFAALVAAGSDPTQLQKELDS